MFRYKRTDTRVYLQYRDVDAGCTLTAEAGGVYNIVPVCEDIPAVPSDFELVEDKPEDKPVVAESPAPVTDESDGE